MTKEQISCARTLCRTILPIKDAQEMGDPECFPATVDIKEAQKRGDPECPPLPATANTHECTRPCARTHDEMCARKPEDNSCPIYKQFVANHADIQKACEEKSRSALCSCFRKQWDKIQAARSCQNEQVDAYISCLGTHSEAIQRQKKINEPSPLIKSAEKPVSVNKLECSMDGVCSIKAIVVGIGQYGPYYKYRKKPESEIETGRCVMVGSQA